MNEPDPSAPPSPRHAALAFAVGVGLTGIALLIAECERPPTWRERAELRLASTRAVAKHIAEARKVATRAEPLPAFATLALARSELPAEGSLRLTLELPEPSADGEPRPVTVLSMHDQRVYTTEGRLDEARKTATIEVPVDFLRSGNYLVQMKTTERTQLPLRRYVVEVR